MSSIFHELCQVIKSPLTTYVFNVSELCQVFGHELCQVFEIRSIPPESVTHLSRYVTS